MDFDLGTLKDRIKEQKQAIEFYQIAMQMLIHVYNLDKLNSLEDLKERYDNLPDIILEDLANGFVPDIESLMLAEIGDLDRFVFDQLKLIGMTRGIEELKEEATDFEEDNQEKYLKWLLSLIPDTKNDALLTAFAVLTLLHGRAPSMLMLSRIVPPTQRDEVMQESYALVTELCSDLITRYKKNPLPFD